MILITDQILAKINDDSFMFYISTQYRQEDEEEDDIWFPCLRCEWKGNNLQIVHKDKFVIDCLIDIIAEKIKSNDSIIDLRNNMIELNKKAKEIEKIKNKQEKELAILKEKAKHGVSFCNKNIEGGLSK